MDNENPGPSKMSSCAKDWVERKNLYITESGNPGPSKMSSCAEAWVERENPDITESGDTAESPNDRFDVIGLLIARASVGGER